MNGQHGVVYRVTPAEKDIPAMAYIKWDEFSSWEKLSDLAPSG